MSHFLKAGALSAWVPRNPSMLCIECKKVATGSLLIEIADKVPTKQVLRYVNNSKVSLSKLPFTHDCVHIHFNKYQARY